MPAPTLLIIRHAEKPLAGDDGDDADSDLDDKSLIPEGWQRAGGWAQLFAPPVGYGTKIAHTNLHLRIAANI